MANQPTTGSTPNPTWYDILGVPRDASPEQVKAAWRAATDKFEPGSGTSHRATWSAISSAVST